MFNFATHQKHILIQKNYTIMKTLFCLFLVLVCSSFVAQAQQKKTAQTIEIPASLKADTISKVTYTIVRTFLVVLYQIKKYPLICNCKTNRDTFYEK